MRKAISILLPGLLLGIIIYLLIINNNIERDYKEYKKEIQEQVDSINNVIVESERKLKNLQLQRDSIGRLLNTNGEVIGDLERQTRELKGELVDIKDRYKDLQRDSIVKIMLRLYAEDTGDSTVVIGN